MLIGCDIAQFRQGLEFVQDLGRPLVELVDIGALQRELELRARCAAADTNVLRCLEEESRALNLVELAAQPRDDLIGIGCALVARFQGNEHAAGVRGITRPAHEHRDVVHRGIVPHDVPELLLVTHHLVGRCFLCGFRNAGQQPDVLLRKKALGDDHEQNDG